MDLLCAIAGEAVVHRSALFECQLELGVLVLEVFDTFRRQLKMFRTPIACRANEFDKPRFVQLANLAVNGRTSAELERLNKVGDLCGIT